MNRTAVRLLQQWDPFTLGEDQYDTEAADVVAALQSTDNLEEIAKVIQEVYEYSFEQWIPLAQCEEIARQLVSLKQQVVCHL